jgi:DUF4097 and DUF4098 domain-containing protein YvlB
MVMAVMIVLLSWAVHAGQKEVVFDETFAVKSGGQLRLDVSDMDVEVKTGSDEGRVVVTLRGDLQKARERFEKSNFVAKLQGNTLVIETEEHRNWVSWGWSSGGGGIQVSVTVPEKFDVAVKTDDGDVVAGNIEGEIELRTSDGDVHLGELKGPTIMVKTSDGDVIAKSLEGGNVELRSSDGDIIVERLAGDDVLASTSDGDVRLMKVDAKSTSVRSSDGDLMIAVSGGELRAKTSDGDIDVRIEGQTAVDLSTSDGDILIRAPADLGAELDLRGEHVKLGGKIALQGEVSKRSIAGTLGDGGPLVRARTSDGTIAFQFD